MSCILNKIMRILYYVIGILTLLSFIFPLIMLVCNYSIGWLMIYLVIFQALILLLAICAFCIYIFNFDDDHDQLTDNNFL